MMEKRLKKYTSIPLHLYVNRNADLQLKRIVDEMQRPGYVLVARQMGKTNLLFNAKRTLENENRLFAYVDLSNVFQQERDCYRNIIDNILEPNENLFEAIETDIEQLRIKNQPPHKEYSKSLRIILEQFKGDLVIVLDEIDALRSAEYSDNIFAQIRSNYFSRTNFPVFERLTYILSGVIEPTELIKDHNKSPFNIGDKIYLEDFTYEEHLKFIEKSELKINSKISEEIFKWTNGNPRLTFDICSSIESLILQNTTINIETVSLLIKEKYLTSFDIAPIDHIRELVKSNREVRKALINIQNGINDISDEIKKKLYLYGIINSQFNDRTEIKNEIIKQSLSLEWIRNIDKTDRKVTLTYALALFGSQDYDDAIEIFEELLLNKEKEAEYESIKYFLGFSYYRLQKYKKALEHITYPFTDNKYKRNSISIGGVCKIASGNSKEGYLDLERIIESENNDFAYQNALYNIALKTLNSDNEKAFELFTQLYNSTINLNPKTDERSLKEINSLKSACLYHKAIIKSEQQDKSQSIDLFNQSLELSDKNSQVYIKFLINEISPSKSNNFKDELVDQIISNNLVFDNQNPYPTSFNENQFLIYLGYIFDKHQLDNFNKLLNYAYHNLYNKEYDKNKIIFWSSETSQNKIQLLEYLVTQPIDDNPLLRDIYYAIAFINKNNFSVFINYFDLYNNYVDRIELSDIQINAIALKLYYENNNPKKGIDLCNNLIPKIELLNDKSLILETVIIHYWLSNFYEYEKNIKKAKENAIRTIELVNNSEKESISMLDKKGLELVKSQMEEIVYPLEFYNPFFTDFKFGRNDLVKVKYKNGNVIEDKFKKLENDIKTKKCVVAKPQKKSYE